MNRTAGLTLRRTAGGGIVFALGFGTFTSLPPETPSVVAAVVPLAGSSPTIELVPQRLPHADMRLIAVAASRTITPSVASKAPGATSTRVAPTPTPRRAASTSRRPAATAKPTPKAIPARNSTAGGSSPFAYGYCTWWVAHKRAIPWRGNAAQWWWNARAFGFAEGATPRPGAIMVMGISRSSPQGHVGYVEAVKADGSFVISEMNWWGVPGGGWGRVDYRTVTSMQGILGFIY